MSQPNSSGVVAFPLPNPADVPQSAPPHTMTPAISGDHLFEAALSRQLATFTWVEPVSLFDREFDVYQHDAVARAMTTPDFLLIQGPSGTGKTRILIEITRQLHRQHAHLLIITQHPSEASHLAKQLERFCPANSIELCGQHRPVSVAELSHEFERHRALHYQQQIAQLQQQRQQRAESLTLLQQWFALQARQEQLNAELQTLRAADEQQRLTFTEQQQQREVELAERIQSREQRLAAITLERQEQLRQIDVAKQQVDELRPKATATQSSGLFSISKWFSKQDTTLLPRLQAAEAAVVTGTETLAKLDAETQILVEATTHEKLAHEAATLTNQAAETERCTQHATAIEQVLARQTALTNALATVAVPLDAFEPTTTRTPERLAALTEAVAEIERNIQAVQKQEANLASEVAEYVAGLQQQHRVRVATFEQLPTLSTDVADYLLVDHADQLTDAQQRGMLRLANRWIFLGEPQEKHLKTGQVRSEWWGRMWHALHCPRTWVHEGAHVVCRLHSLTAAERRKCDREPVADNPSIELRLTTHLQEPLLAEVAFPANYQPSAARDFLRRELDAVMLQPTTHLPIWNESSDRITCRFSPAAGNTFQVPVSPGVIEEARDLDTAAIHFMLADGWNVAQASAWVNEHALPRSTCRAVALHHPHRACPGLAKWLNEAFRFGFVLPSDDYGENHVEFLAVPDLKNRRESANPRAVRPGGAGYEIALSDQKQREIIADDLAPKLPHHGYVNLAEAQAIIQYLENHPHLADSTRVTSPFPAQILVLKHLLASSRVSQVRVLELADCDHIEVDHLIISLTRSHISRAVTFGESPAIIRKLVSTARRRLLFAGDPGTLSRRLQWEGPVDHLDGTESAHERSWVSALAICPRVNLSRHRATPSTAG